MAYLINQPPFTLDFPSMTKKELRAYAMWFHAISDERIIELTKAVRETAGFEEWKPNLKPSSLNRLGEWYAKQVETRARTQEEMEYWTKDMKFPIEVSNQELTNKTFSLALDIGMYLGKVFMTEFPNLKWDQPLGSKNFVHYGQPVLMGFGKVPFNPVHVNVVLARGLVDGTRTGYGLREIFDIRSKHVVV
jgi:hypothetical protein